MVIMDIGLPAFDGYHWCTEIRRISKCPILFLSAVHLPQRVHQPLPADDLSFALHQQRQDPVLVFREVYRCAAICEHAALHVVCSGLLSVSSAAGGCDVPGGDLPFAGLSVRRAGGTGCLQETQRAKICQPVCLQFLAQPPDIDCQRIVIDIAVHLPQRVHQIQVPDPVLVLGIGQHEYGHGDEYGRGLCRDM